MHLNFAKCTIIIPEAIGVIDKIDMLEQGNSSYETLLPWIRDSIVDVS